MSKEREWEERKEENREESWIDPDRAIVSVTHA
jgi:hypothetical protein